MPYLRYASDPIAYFQDVLGVRAVEVFPRTLVDLAAGNSCQLRHERGKHVHATITGLPAWWVDTRENAEVFVLVPAMRQANMLRGDIDRACAHAWNGARSPHGIHVVPASRADFERGRDMAHAKSALFIVSQYEQIAASEDARAIDLAHYYASHGATVLMAQALAGESSAAA